MFYLFGGVSYYSCHFPVHVYIDVENPWFPCENDLQIVFCFDIYVSFQEGTYLRLKYQMYS